MLVLTRKKGESIRIGDDVEIIVRRISGNRVAIAIEAPGHVSILRGELDLYPEEERNSETAAPSSDLANQERYMILQGRFSPDELEGLLPDANELV